MSPHRQVITDPSVPTPPFHYAPALKCGPFVFASGQTATDWRSGLAPQARLPHLGNSARAEICYIYRNLLALARAGGCGVRDVLRMDSFYAAPRIQDGHFRARDDFWGEGPLGKFASTGYQATRFLPTGTRMMMDLIGGVPDGETRREPVWAEQIGGSRISIPMGVRYGDLVLISGRMAYDAFVGGLAEKARTPDWIWQDWPPPARAQTAYLLDQLAIVLDAAGSSLRDVVKSTVYLLTPDDITFVDDVWREYFPDDPPARCFVIADRLAMKEGVVEINFVAVTSNGRTRKEVIRAADAPAPLFHEAQAVKAGPLLFLSNQTAADEQGLVATARPHPDFPFNAASGRVQMETTLRNVDAICRAAGGSLADVARVQTLFTDLVQFDAAHEVWKRAFPETPPAWTIAQVRGPLPVEGAVLHNDVIAYIPD